MKEGWERTESPASLDLMQINEIIKPAFPGKKVITAERLGTGLSNNNYKIYLDGCDIPKVLRLYRGNSGIATKEHAISSLVRETVPVANFLYVDTSYNTCDKTWAVMEWKEGVLLRDVLKKGSEKDIVTAARSVGSVLANIHSYTFTGTGFFDGNLKVSDPYSISGELFLDLIEQNLFQGSCEKWLGKELTKAVWSFCQTYSSLFSELVEVPVLVHSDFNGLNILMQSVQVGYSVSAVLDWEFAFSWTRYVDLANILRYEEEGSILEEHLIRAYQEHGGILHENWRLISKLEDLVALCNMLKNSTVDMPNRIRDLQSLIARNIQQKG